MRAGSCIALLLMAAFIAPASAQEAKEVWEEYGNRVERSRAVAALGPDLMGDHVSLSDGSLSFRVTDLDIPGNSALRVAFTRTVSIEDRTDRIRDAPLGDWNIDLPSISGVFAPNWISGTASSPNSRCSAAPTPPTVSIGMTYFHPRDYWQGIHLNIPGGAGGELLRTTAQAPSPTGMNSVWVTGDGGTHLSCLSSIENGTGEGFLAITPDGTRYWFNWMGQFMEPTLKAPGQPTVIGRRKNVLYATRVEDRFGNWVEYTYTNNWNQPVRLTGIASSDQRSISVGYGSNGLINSVSDGARTWNYQYSGALSLTKVVLPDNSSWNLELDELSSIRMHPFRGPPSEPWRSCLLEPHPLVDGPFTGTITHPSGATGEFIVDVKRHGRTNVPVNCDNFSTPGNDPNDDVSFWTISYDGFSLQSKSVSGPGIPQMTWNYAYSSPWSVYYPSGNPDFPVCPVGMDCGVPECVSDACAGSITTTVTGPDGVWTRYRHGNSFRYNEGKLLSVETGTGSTVHRSSASNYDYTSALRFGVSPRHRGDGFATEYVRPQLSSTITQQGVDFSWQANAFDAFARPTNVTRASTLAGAPTRTDVTQYHDNLGKWVVGQVSKTTTNGVVASEASYNADALPTVFKQFGRTVQTLTYDKTSSITSGQRGTVRTVADGNGNATTLTGWKRGIPQLIRYPATPEAPSGDTQAAVVNNHGWVTRITDENGFQSNYQYDAMGRLSRIAYPTGDSVAWHPTTLGLVRASGGAYGLPAGHWQHTVTTGNARQVTYLDALWRPVLVREYDTGNASGTQRFTRQTFDHGGRVLFTSYPAASGTSTTGTWTEYDALGRPTSVSQDSELGLLVSMTRYLSGFRTRVTSPKGGQTTTGYLAWDEPTSDYPVAITHPGGAFTDITRNMFGKPTGLTRRNSNGSVSLTRHYVYDAHQQLCKSVEPETGATIMAYDAAGNLAWSRAGATQTGTSSCNTSNVPVVQRTVRNYDARNRIRSLVFPDNLGNTTYDYTPDGLLAQVTVDNGGVDIVSTAYNYNRRRLPTGEAVSIGTHQWGIGYGYNAAGYLQTHVLPSGLIVDYAPNALGQPTQAGSYATGASYFPRGDLKQFSYGNGIVRTHTQNARGLPERVRDVHGGTVFHDDSLDYDQHGNVAAISDALSGHRGDRTMTYDALDRLTGTVSPMFGTATYTYDVLDNLRTVRLTSGPRSRNHTYVYDGTNRLTTVTNTAGGATVAALAYDVQGNLASRNGQAYQFDYGNRLRSVPGVEGYLYDGHGRRVKAVRNGASIYSVYGQDGVLRFQRDERAGKTIEYVHLGGSLVAQVEDSIALATPTLTVPGYSGTGSYTVSWTASTYATKYQLQERQGTGSWSTVHNAAGTNKSFSGKAAGTWGYRLRACSASSCGAWSPVAAVTVQLPPTAAPTLTVPGNGLNGAYAVSWSAVSGASKYQLQERQGTGSWSTVHNAAGTSKSFSGKAAGSWGYRVRACNDAGCGGWSATSSVQVTLPPGGAPALTVPATSYTGAYTVSWSAVSTSTRYELQERLGSGGWTLIHETAPTSRAVSGRAAGTWGYRVRACNAAGCSAYSPVSTTAVTLSPTATTTVTTPATSYTGAYTVSWGTVATATRYELQERLGSGSWTRIHNAAQRTRAITGKTAGSWRYRVRGCNVAGCAAYSAVVTTQVTLPPASAPALTAPSSSGNGSYTVSWSSVATANRYRLQERLGSGSWATIHDAAGLSLARTGKTNGSWRYRVAACNAAGCGSYSATRTVSVQLLTPAVPTGLTVVSQGFSCTASWNTVSGATSYKLQPGLYQGPYTSYYVDMPCGTAARQVAACNSHGCSAWSTPVTPTVVPGGPGPFAADEGEEE